MAAEELKYVKCKSKLFDYWYIACIPKDYFLYGVGIDIEITKDEFENTNKHYLNGSDIIMNDIPRKLYIIIPEGYKVNPDKLLFDLIPA